MTKKPGFSGTVTTYDVNTVAATDYIMSGAGRFGSPVEINKMELGVLKTLKPYGIKKDVEIIITVAEGSRAEKIHLLLGADPYTVKPGTEILKIELG